MSAEGCGFVLGEGAARAWTVKPAFCSLERTPVAEQHAAAGSSTCIGATCAPPAAQVAVGAPPQGPRCAPPATQVAVGDSDAP